MAFPKIGKQVAICHCIGFKHLDPFSTARREIGSGAQSRLFPEDIKSQIAGLEHDMRIIAIGPPGNGKHLAAHFPDIGATPLHHMGNGAKRLTKCVNLFARQRLLFHRFQLLDKAGNHA